jgi:hypothetical protein
MATVESRSASGAQCPCCDRPVGDGDVALGNVFEVTDRVNGFVCWVHYHHFLGAQREAMAAGVSLGGIMRRRLEKLRGAGKLPLPPEADLVHQSAP